MLERLYIGKNIVELDVVDSTNNYASDLVTKNNALEGTVVVAHYQGSGKGQRGNVWTSEPGKNLTFSLVLKPKKVSPSEAFVISKIVSLAICKYLDTVVEEDVFIKWPNDIYVGQKKICGILIENQFKGKKFESSIIGIGLNVNQSNFQNLPRVTSLILELKKELELRSVLDDLLKSIEICYLRLQREGVSMIHEEYLVNLLFIDEMRRYKTSQGEIIGKIVNVLSNGKVEIETKEGQLFNFDIKELAFEF
jgi:BirA family transcriptional regulator, biotin operon repressor / biotin---[acetyl-CoA-carboxylase] ligase